MALSTPKSSPRVRACEASCHTSDGYYVFIALIGIVVAMTCAIVLAFGIEMLA